MFMKHYAPNSCEPSIEVIVKMGSDRGGWGSVSSKVGGSGWCGVNAKKGVRLGVDRVEVNQELNLL